MLLPTNNNFLEKLLLIADISAIWKFLCFLWIFSHLSFCLVYNLILYWFLIKYNNHVLREYVLQALYEVFMGQGI